MRKVMTLFGTRPEAIKFAPVIRALSRFPSLRIVNTLSSQHTDLLYPFVQLFGIDVAHDLKIMRPGQQPSQVLSRVITAFDDVLATERPDLVLVQGDTTTALAGALAAFHRKIPVGHIEAGLRSGNPDSPFPEEMNRRLIGRIARLNFAATADNVTNLEREGVDPESIVQTGNPVVDALQWIRADTRPGEAIRNAIAKHSDRRIIVLTTHRRENFGASMRRNLEVLRKFVRENEDVALVFPVHPNPEVRAVTTEILHNSDRVVLLDPLDYGDFIHLLSHAWLVVSDSGGVQEEAPSLGKPLLVIRENTERPEAIESGVAKLVGESPEKLDRLLREAAAEGSWIEKVASVSNPFGTGDAGTRIAEAIASFLEETNIKRSIAN